MGKKATIKEIARLAGVSAGTVDRILHNRGKVSAANAEAVSRVLEEVEYRSNIHTSAVGYSRILRIAVTTPESSPGDYWSQVERGIAQATEEYNDVNIQLIPLPYDQFDSQSCLAAFSRLPELKPDAVIIGPSFSRETKMLCEGLDKDNIPYVLVDASLEGTNPLASFSVDQSAAGWLQARLLDMMTAAGKSIALFEAEVAGGSKSINGNARREGWDSYFSGRERKILFCRYNTSDEERTAADFAALLDSNPEIGGIAVQNSRGAMLASLLERHSRTDISLVSFDLTDGNKRCLESGSIQALLCQRPELQGYKAVVTILKYMFYKRPGSSEDCLGPIDIVMKANLPYYLPIERYEW